MNLTGSLTVTDFSFATGETFLQTGFTTLAGTALTDVDPQITEYVGSGLGESTRSKITFNNNSFKNTWLRLIVHANAEKGLATDSVFYFGNLVSEVDGSAANDRYTVNAIDTAEVRMNQNTVPGVIDVTNIYDFDKSGRVNAIDTSIFRTNQQPSGVIKVLTGTSSFLASFRELADLAHMIERSSSPSKSSTTSNDELLPL